MIYTLLGFVPGKHWSCLSFFSCCFGKIAQTEQKHFKGGSFYFSLQFTDAVHHSMGVRILKELLTSHEQCRLRYLRVLLCSVHFLVFIQSRIPA